MFQSRKQGYVSTDPEQSKERYIFNDNTFRFSIFFSEKDKGLEAKAQ